ncbi:MAG TPA: hypothetical protein VMI75_28075 [Polyangiaceae bacterium]|nr:hypothetical protein [Polyangiaceae bacterium]
MKTILKLTQLRDNALKAVAADPKSERLLDKLAKASLALATAQATLQSKTITRKYEETVEDEGDDDEEEEEEEEEAEEEEEEEENAKSSDDEPKKPLMKKGEAEEQSEEGAEEEEEEEEAADKTPPAASDHDDDDDSSDGGSTSSSSDGSDADESARAQLNAKTGLYTHDRLWRLVTQVTGKREVAAAFGALDAMGQRVKAAEALEGRIARLEGDKRKARVDAMLKDAIRMGKIDKAAKPTLRAQGMRDPKWLKGHLDVLPTRTRTSEMGVLDGADLPMRGDVKPMGGAIAIDVKSLSGDQRKAIESMLLGTGKTIEQYVAEMNETSAKRKLRAVGQ